MVWHRVLALLDVMVLEMRSKALEHSLACCFVNSGVGADMFGMCDREQGKEEQVRLPSAVLPHGGSCQGSKHDMRETA